MALSRRQRRAYTLIEILVVLFLIGILTFLLLPAVQYAREMANRVGCKNNLHQIGLALNHYHDAAGSFPPAYHYSNPRAASGTPGAPSAPVVLRFPSGPRGVPTDPGWGWAAYLLPYLDQEPLFKRINFNESIATEGNRAARTTILRIYVCPTDRDTGLYWVKSEANKDICEVATISYASCYGAGGSIGENPSGGNGMFFRNSQTRLGNISDGASNTIAVGERATLFCPVGWAGAVSAGTARIPSTAPVSIVSIEESPTQVMCRFGSKPLNHPWSEPYDFYTPHAGVAMFVFADGSVHPVSTATDLSVLRALATIAGNETIDASAY